MGATQSCLNKQMSNCGRMLCPKIRPVGICKWICVRMQVYCNFWHNYLSNRDNGNWDTAWEGLKSTREHVHLHNPQVSRVKEDRN